MPDGVNGAKEQKPEHKKRAISGEKRTLDSQLLKMKHTLPNDRLLIVFHISIPLIHVTPSYRSSNATFGS